MSLSEFNKEVKLYSYIYTYIYIYVDLITFRKRNHHKVLYFLVIFCLVLTSSTYCELTIVKVIDPVWEIYDALYCVIRQLTNDFQVIKL